MTFIICTFSLQSGETIKEVLIEKTGARSLEQTNRTDGIGKYFLVIEKNCAGLLFFIKLGTLNVQ